MLICDTCKQSGEQDTTVCCPKCGKVFHMNVECVKAKEVRFELDKDCGACGAKTKTLNERVCPLCGTHLWYFHIDCGGVF